MKKMFAVVTVAAMALTGCGNVCDDMANAYEAGNDKYKPCASQGETFEAFNVNQCENNLDKCSDSEKEALEKLADCIRDLPECTPATEENFNNAAFACGLGLAGKVGENCLSTLGSI